MINRIFTYIIIIILAFLLVAQISCTKKENYKLENLNHNTLMILGHRGMGEFFQYPGNTIESVKPVLDIGADGSELDIQITKDSVLVLYHNDVLEGRTTCNGKIYDYLWEEINHCYYSGIQSYVPLTSAEQLFASIENLNEYYFSFDCKLDIDNKYNIGFRKMFLRAVQKLCTKYKMENHVFLEGDLGFLLLAKELGMKNKGFVIGSTVENAKNNNIFGIGASLNTSIDTIDYAHKNGIYVMMWGAKSDLGNKQALKLNPDIIQTDKPIPLLMLLDRMNYETNVP